MRAVLVVAVVAIAAAVVALAGRDAAPPADGGAAAAAVVPPGTVVRGCESRIEPAGPPPTPEQLRASRRVSVVLPDVTFWGLRRAQRAPFDREPFWKAAVSVPSGAPVTIKVADHHRGFVGLDYDGRRGREGSPAVRFEPCPPDTAGFSGGTVGRETSFAGGFVVARPGCATLVARRGDRGRWARVDVGFGVRCR